MLDLMPVAAGDSSATWNSGTFSSATSAVGAVLLSLGYAAANPQPRSSAASIDYVQTDGTFVVNSADDFTGAFLSAVHHVHNQLLTGAVELPKEDLQLVYDRLWDLYEP